MDLFADLTPPQRAAVAHVDGPLLVLAGAGSGKRGSSPGGWPTCSNAGSAGATSWP